MATTAATASTSRESVGASCGVGTGPAEEGAEAAEAATYGEIEGRPR